MYLRVSRNVHGGYASVECNVLWSDTHLSWLSSGTGKVWKEVGSTHPLFPVALKTPCQVKLRLLPLEATKGYTMFLLT